MRLSRKLLFCPDTIKTEYLNSRVCDLDLRINGNLLGQAVQRAREEIREFGVGLDVNFYLSDGYGCVENTVNIGLGFWDADENLREIRRDLVGRIRDQSDLLLLLKHEVGHAFGYAHRLYELDEFRKVFHIRGDFFASYPPHDRYSFDPYSADYVNPDNDHYAQKHPDDDFAETFATVIDPKEGWRERYKGRAGALKKIAFVLRIIRDHGQKPVKLVPREGFIDAPYQTIRKTVAQFFRVSRKRYFQGAHGYIDDELEAIFRRPGRLQRTFLPAPTLLRKYRRFIESSIRERVRPRDPELICDLLDKVRVRVKALGLVYLKEEQDRALAELYGLVLHKTVLFSRFGMFRLL